MNTSSLKFKVLEYLFDFYIKQPAEYVNIHQFLEQNGIRSEASIISFGYALKAAGFLKKDSSCNSEGAFMACLSVNGVDFVSTLIKDETRQLIRFAIESEADTFIALEENLKLISNNSEYTNDISIYLKENSLADIKEIKGKVYFKLSDLAYIIFNGSPSKWDREEGEEGLYKSA